MNNGIIGGAGWREESLGFHSRGGGEGGGQGSVSQSRGQGEPRSLVAGRLGRCWCLKFRKSGSFDQDAVGECNQGRAAGREGEEGRG